MERVDASEFLAREVAKAQQEYLSQLPTDTEIVLNSTFSALVYLSPLFIAYYLWVFRGLLK